MTATRICDRSSSITSVAREPARMVIWLLGLVNMFLSSGGVDLEVAAPVAGCSQLTMTKKGKHLAAKWQASLTRERTVERPATRPLLKAATDTISNAGSGSVATTLVSRDTWPSAVGIPLP